MITNDLRYFLLISISAHTAILWWLFSTIPVPVGNNTISQQEVMNVTLFSEISKTSENNKKQTQGTSLTRKSRSWVKKSQPESGITKSAASEATETGRAKPAPTGENGFQPTAPAAGTGATGATLFEGAAMGERSR